MDDGSFKSHLQALAEGHEAVVRERSQLKKEHALLIQQLEELQHGGAAKELREGGAAEQQKTDHNILGFTPPPYRKMSSRPVAFTFTPSQAASLAETSEKGFQTSSASQTSQKSGESGGLMKTQTVETIGDIENGHNIGDIENGQTIVDIEGGFLAGESYDLDVEEEDSDIVSFPSESTFRQEVIQGPNRRSSDMSYNIGYSRFSQTSVKSVGSRFSKRSTQSMESALSDAARNVLVEDMMFPRDIDMSRTAAIKFVLANEFSARVSLARRLSQDGKVRQLVHEIVDGRSVEVIMGLVVLFNMLVIIFETDANAKCKSGCTTGWIDVANMGLLFVYSIELLLRLYAHRCSFFTSPLNFIDFFIVVIGWTDFFATLILVAADIPALQMLRMFRITRLARTARLLSLFPELAAMVQGFASAMKAMLWGFLMLMVLLFVLGILIVEIVGPISERVEGQSDECKEAYSSVWLSCVNAFQTLMAGDGWGECSSPVMAEEPWTFLLFALALVGVQLGYTNLIMSVIIDIASKAHDENVEERARQKQLQRAQARKKLLKICECVDCNGTGQITAEGLMIGCNRVPALRDVFELLGLDTSDLPMLLELLDTEGNGFLTYREFVDVFEKVDRMDPRMQHMIDHLYLLDLGRKVAKEVGLPKRRIPSSRQSACPSLYPEVC